MLRLPFLYTAGGQSACCGFSGEAMMRKHAEGNGSLCRLLDRLLSAERPTHSGAVARTMLGPPRDGWGESRWSRSVRREER
jgi:hypothetical protein